MLIKSKRTRSIERAIANVREVIFDKDAPEDNALEKAHWLLCEAACRSMAADWRPDQAEESS